MPVSGSLDGEHPDKRLRLQQMAKSQIDLRQQIIHDLNLALEGLPAMVTPLDHHASTRELRRMTAEDVRRVVEHEPTWDECAEAMGVFQTLWPVLQKFQKV